MTVFATFLAVGFVSGCITRPDTPGLPYVKLEQARSVESGDTGRIQLASRMESLETELQKLRDQLERLQAAGGSQQALTDLERRVAFIERQLAIGPPSRGQVHVVPGPTQERSTEAVGSPSSSTADQPSDPTSTDDTKVEIRNAPLTEDEKAFREAYSLVQKGELIQAEPLMREFLKKYKQSKFAANAVYWIGEALMVKGKFSEAVLEFDRVIKEYPGSEKELSARLKQGQAFQKMGDSESARIIFEKLISKHPHTAQARLAKSQLKSLPKAKTNPQ